MSTKFEADNQKDYAAPLYCAVGVNQIGDE